MKDKIMPLTDNFLKCLFLFQLPQLVTGALKGLAANTELQVELCSVIRQHSRDAPPEHVTEG